MPIHKLRIAFELELLGNQVDPLSAEQAQKIVDNVTEAIARQLYDRGLSPKGSALMVRSMRIKSQLTPECFTDFNDFSPTPPPERTRRPPWQGPPDETIYAV